MSIFQGKLQEYPFIAIDNFTVETHDCTAYLLSHCHTDHMEGLSSEEFLQRLKANNMVHLYCSETTKNLMMSDDKLRPLGKYTRDIPINQSTVIHIQGDESEGKTLVVTLIPAGHCVGSVMFFFEGDQGAVLYTGDFRLRKGDIKRVPCLKTGDSVKRIQGLYIDTTFCDPMMEKLPKREDTRDAMVTLMSSWLRKGANYAVYIQCSGKYGYEYILKEVAQAFKTKVHLDDEKFGIYSAVAGMIEHTTTNKFSTQIHSCRWRAKRSFSSYLPCGISHINGLPVKVMTIKPSTLWFAKWKCFPEDHISYDKRQGTYRVVHSMHASYEEIRDVVAYIRPKYVYPTVTPVDTDDILEAYDRLKDLLRPKDDDSQGPIENEGNQEKSISIDLPPNSSTKDAWQLGIQSEAVLSPTRAKVRFTDLGIDNEADSPPMTSSRRRLKKRKQNEAGEEGGDAKTTKCSELFMKIDNKEAGKIERVLQEDKSSSGVNRENASLEDEDSKVHSDFSLTLDISVDPGDSERILPVTDLNASSDIGASEESELKCVDNEEQIRPNLVRPNLCEELSNESIAKRLLPIRALGQDESSLISNIEIKPLDVVKNEMTGSFEDESEIERDFDIPVTPGCEGPSEEKLHSIYLSISNGETLLKR